MNGNSRPLRDDLWRALADRGLLLDTNAYHGQLSRVTDAGREQIASLREDMTRAQWGRACDDFAVLGSEGDLERILGFGRMLTAYAMAPADDGLSGDACDAIGRIGALANLVVTMFDNVLERERVAPVLPDALEALSREGGARLVRKTLRAQAREHRTLHRLTYRYFRTLRALPHANDRPEVARLTRRAILRMHGAEIETTLSHSCRDRSLRRKSSLPFVVLGLPVWLATERACAADIRSHTRWLYRLGEFIGWLDDIIDLPHDRASGHPNRIDRMLTGGATSEAALVQIVATAGARVHQGWRARDAERYRQTEQVLPAVVISWFGGWPDGSVT